MDCSLEGGGGFSGRPPAAKTRTPAGMQTTQAAINSASVSLPHKLQHEHTGADI
jgi:hypothetical protein